MCDSLLCDLEPGEFPRNPSAPEDQNSAAQDRQLFMIAAQAKHAAATCGEGPDDRENLLPRADVDTLCRLLQDQ
jgi:hypothetical protein